MKFKFLNILTVATLCFQLTIKSNTQNELPINEIVENDISNDNEAYKAAKTGQPIQLTSPVLQLVDGKKKMMDAERVGHIICMGKEVDAMENGLLENIDEVVRQLKAGKFNIKNFKRRPYKFQNKVVTLSQLLKIESSIKKDKNADPRQVAEMKKALNEIKEYFMKFATPFLVSAKGTKQHMYQLVRESCLKTNRHDSLLLHWGSGKEDELLKNNVTSLRQLNQFFIDLSQFFRNLLYSCPKAVAQYKEAYKIK